MSPEFRSADEIEGRIYIPIIARELRVQIDAVVPLRQGRCVRDTRAGEIMVYQNSSGARALEGHLHDATVWLTQDQTAQLCSNAKLTINEHIKNVFGDGKLVAEQVMRTFTISAFSTAPTNLCNLDVIISAGCSVKSLRGTQFRIWAAECLCEYLVKGFTMDDARAKNLTTATIGKSCSSASATIAQARKRSVGRCSTSTTSVDYTPKGDESLILFITIQNKLHYSAYGHIAAEVIAAPPMRQTVHGPYVIWRQLAEQSPHHGCNEPGELESDCAYPVVQTSTQETGL